MYLSSDYSLDKLSRKFDDENRKLKLFKKKEKNGN